MGHAAERRRRVCRPSKLTWRCLNSLLAPFQTADDSRDLPRPQSCGSQRIDDRERRAFFNSGSPYAQGGRPGRRSLCSLASRQAWCWERSRERDVPTRRCSASSPIRGRPMCSSVRTTAFFPPVNRTNSNICPRSRSSHKSWTLPSSQSLPRVFLIWLGSIQRKAISCSRILMGSNSTQSIAQELSPDGCPPLKSATRS